MKLTQIAATLIAAATLLTAALPAQADEIYNLNPFARASTNAIYQDLLKYPDIHCHIAVQVYYSVVAVDKRQGLSKKTIDAANTFVSKTCKNSVEYEREWRKIAANPTFQSPNVQMLTTKQFLDLYAALNELSQNR
jgi:hypothetical protein